MGDADTGADPHFLTGHGEGPAQNVHDPPPDRDGMVWMPHQYRELVTAQSRGRVPFTHAAQQPLRRELQQLVTGRMPQRIVDVLEAVQIDDDDRDGTLGARLATQRLGQPVEQQHPVRQARQRVVQRLAAELVLERTPIGDIAPTPYEATHVRILDQVLAHGLDQPHPAIPGAQAQLDGVHQPRMLDEEHHRPRDAPPARPLPPG